jgi:hypothetical protein
MEAGILVSIYEPIYGMVMRGYTNTRIVGYGVPEEVNLALRYTYKK